MNIRELNERKILGFLTNKDSLAKAFHSPGIATPQIAPGLRDDELNYFIFIE